jgi:glycosyltransferase involved in cell wall biosynthesis
MKFGFFGFPHLGGTYSVFRNLRLGLAPQGIELQWLSASAEAHAAAQGAFFRAEQAYGQLVGKPGDAPQAQARALHGVLANDGFDGVIVNVLADPVETNIVRYLPPRLVRVMIVHNITPGTYAAAAAIRDYVHATVAISPRMRDDLIARYGFRPERLKLIPHGVARSPAPRIRRPQGSPLRVLFLGRIDEQAKGVFWLPAIYNDLQTPAALTIAGDGPDLPPLRRRLARFGERVKVLGGVAPEAARQLFASHDVFVMPSRFEGFGMVLVEAMSAGCVPVASHIAGVTDAIVAHGSSGHLFPVGHTRAASAAIDSLAADPSQLRTMSRSAVVSVREKFGLDRFADGYRELFTQLADTPPAIPPARDLARWDTPPGLRPGLRTRLPVPVKNLARQWRERLAAH